MDSIQSAIAKKDILDTLRPIDPEREQIIMQKFRLDWNYHSNHIEGNSLSYGETRALILFGITGSAKPLKDYLEVEGHNSAIDWVLDVIKDKHDLTENFIRELHTLLLKSSLKAAVTGDGKPTTKRIEVGKYKTLPNHVLTKTNEIFRFATPEETPAKMHDLLEWYHAQRRLDSINPILLAAEFHYKFIRIHPFDDGNGRMARILMNFILMQYGYPPVIIKTEDKENYYIALRQADANIFNPFLEYIALNLNRSLDIIITGAQGESIEEPDDIDKELALLEQQINNTNKKIEVYRTSQVITDLVDGIANNVLEKYISQCKKITSYYKNSDFHIVIDDAETGDYNENANSLQQLINWIMESHGDYTNFHKLSFSYEFHNFLPQPNKKATIDIYLSYINIEFHAVSFQISNSIGDTLVRHYNDDVTDSQIENIVKKEVLKHMRFISQKIKETE